MNELERANKYLKDLYENNIRTSKEIYDALCNYGINDSEIGENIKSDVIEILNDTKPMLQSKNIRYTYSTNFGGYNYFCLNASFGKKISDSHNIKLSVPASLNNLWSQSLSLYKFMINNRICFTTTLPKTNVNELLVIKVAKVNEAKNIIDCYNRSKFTEKSDILPLTPTYKSVGVTSDYLGYSYNEKMAKLLSDYFKTTDNPEITELLSYTIGNIESKDNVEKVMSYNIIKGISSIIYDVKPINQFEEKPYVYCKK